MHTHSVQLQYRELGLAGAETGILLFFQRVPACYFHRSLTSSVDLPKPVGRNAATDIILSGRKDTSFSNHTRVLASQVAWITGESQQRQIYRNIYIAPP